MTDRVPNIDPARAALLVMDYQVGIVSRVPDPAGLIRRAREVIATARARGVCVGYVRVAFDDADYETMPATNKSFSAIASGRAMHNEASETAIHDDVAPEPGDIIVRKTRVGAFSTDLISTDSYAERGIDTLILAGISTSGVVLSTVRDAADRDYRVYVLEDGSADPDPETHAFLTQRIFPRQAEVITITELADLISS